MEIDNQSTRTRAEARQQGQRLKGLRVAVTGGTSGLGLALVRKFASAGASVAFVARDRKKIGQPLTDISGTHGIAGDVSHKEDIYPMAIEITGELSGLDVHEFGDSVMLEAFQHYHRAGGAP
jgi:NAD(P)-dependent dehydrogenase (short-subunit alcohol dehydrogenase family)